ncbi:hypothetical protein [Vibrio algicola]|uniref:Uncharacterized protein n=1 Tax=Vibrio algicola TaxID=2662262 RepID=A0A5Q0TDJ6_9VIBR|nr:hypothetical protein [Vibrio algicola]
MFSWLENLYDKSEGWKRRLFLQTMKRKTNKGRALISLSADGAFQQLVASKDPSEIEANKKANPIKSSLFFASYEALIVTTKA